MSPVQNGAALLMASLMASLQPEPEPGPGPGPGPEFAVPSRARASSSLHRRLDGHAVGQFAELPNEGCCSGGGGRGGQVAWWEEYEVLRSSIEGCATHDSLRSCWYRNASGGSGSSPLESNRWLLPRCSWDHSVGFFAAVKARFAAVATLEVLSGDDEVDLEHDDLEHDVKTLATLLLLEGGRHLEHSFFLRFVMHFFFWPQTTFFAVCGIFFHSRPTFLGRIVILLAAAGASY